MKKYDLKERIERIKQTVSISAVMQQYSVDLKREGAHMVALCPFHTENTPSFFVYQDRTFHCYGCEAHGDVINFLMRVTPLKVLQVVEFLDGRFVTAATSRNLEPILVDLKDYENIPVFDRKSIFSRKDSTYKSVSADQIYEYNDADGSPVGYILVKRDRNTGKKFVRPISLYECPTEGLVWAFKGMDEPRPLYNLPEILNNPDKPVLVVEGEKCAAMAKQYLPEFVVTTWSQGSCSVDKTDFSPLDSREVFIWPDNDPNGILAAESIARDLQYAEIIQVSKTLPKGWDIADEIQAGKTAEELTKLILYFRIPRVKEEYKPVSQECLPPGLLGGLTKFILSASTHEHPILATGAAIAVMATLFAQKCVTEDNIHPNLYIVTLAPSGIGKSSPLELTKSILISLGCEKLIGGTPASGSGLISALHRRQGRAFLPIDEFGKVFAQIVRPGENNYKQDIVTKLLMLFSNSNSQYTDDEYSDRQQQREVRIIRKPNLVLYGTTVPCKFYESMSLDDGANGFLARLMVLSGVDKSVTRKTYDQVTKKMPEQLKKVLLTWAYDPTNTMASEENTYDFVPTVIRYESQARKLMDKYAEESIQIALMAEEAEDEFKSSLYRRCFEKASKLALLARTDNHYIDTMAVEWAIKFTRESTERYYNDAKNYLHDGLFAKKSKQIERYLKKKENWTTKAELANRFRMPLKQLKEMLDWLIESGIIQTKSIKRKIATTTYFRYNFSK